MKKLKLCFEKGGTLIAVLNDKAPNTVKSILEILPIESTMVHTRWCGREISLGIKTIKKPPMENCTNIVNKFDIAYWRDWNNIISSEDATFSEALAIYYGPEILRYHGGFLTTNIIGRILWEQEELLEEIEIRIWRHGQEKVFIEEDK